MQALYKKLHIKKKKKKKVSGSTSSAKSVQMVAGEMLNMSQ